MARYTDSVCRLCAAARAQKLFLKGDRCYGPRSARVAKRPTPPGQHGQSPAA